MKFRPLKDHLKRNSLLNNVKTLVSSESLRERYGEPLHMQLDDGKPLKVMQVANTLSASSSNEQWNEVKRELSVRFSRETHMKKMNSLQCQSRMGSPHRFFPGAAQTSYGVFLATVASDLLTGGCNVWFRQHHIFVSKVTVSDHDSWNYCELWVDRKKKIYTKHLHSLPF